VKAEIEIPSHYLSHRQHNEPESAMHRGRMPVHVSFRAARLQRREQQCRESNEVSIEGEPEGQG
jgi:hypothetical protein